MRYAFGGDTALTPEAIKRRRAIAEAMRGQQRAPRNVGEGIHSFARSIAGALMDRRADRQERRLQDEADEMFSGLFGGTSSASGANSVAPVGQQPPMGRSQPGELGFPESLIETESGGNFGARNNVAGSGGTGHFGRLQFSHGRLDDARRAGVIPENLTPEQFLANPAVQERVEAWHFSDIDNFIRQNGYDRLVGGTINGQPVTMDGMRAVAHLGGKGGLQKFIETGGEYNPADAFGTSLSDYFQRHAGSDQPSQGSQPQLQQIAAALGNPMIASDPGRRAVLQAMLQQEMAANAPVDPYEARMRDLEMRRAEAQLAQMENPQPDPTDDMREYEFARSQGYDGSFQDFMMETRRAGATSVNVNNAGMEVEPLGTDGQILVRDPSAPGGYRVVVAENSKLAREQAAEEEQRETAERERERTRKTRSNVVSQTVGNIRALLDKRGALDLPEVGIIGSRLTGVNQEAADMAGMIDTLKGMVVFDRLDKLRQASASGASGLGQVTAPELALLGAQLGALDQSLSEKQLRQTLDNIEDVFTRLSPEAQSYLTGAGGDELPVFSGQAAAPGADSGEMSLDEALSVAEGVGQPAAPLGVSAGDVARYRDALDERRRREFDARSPEQQADVVQRWLEMIK